MKKLVVLILLLVLNGIFVASESSTPETSTDISALHAFMIIVCKNNEKVKDCPTIDQSPPSCDTWDTVRDCLTNSGCKDAEIKRVKEKLFRGAEHTCGSTSLVSSLLLVALGLFSIGLR